MDIRSLINAINEADDNARRRYHVTLGKLIAAIENMPGGTLVVFDDGKAGPSDPHSYRGYYSDLSFESGDGVTVAQLLADCRESLGKTFEGYKGGDYTMREDTPLWWASYGCCGRAIVDIREDAGRLVLVTKETD